MLIRSAPLSGSCPGKPVPVIDRGMLSCSGIARVLVGLLVCLALPACGEEPGPAAAADAFDLPVGQTEWDAFQPTWYVDGTLHVGDRTVELGDRVDKYVVAPTGVYWMRAGMLMFTSAEDETQEVAPVGWGNFVISADRSVFATVDQSRGPTDRYGTYVMQVAVFDTRTGEQLYRTPDEEPDKGADLADLYGEIMPLLDGVSNDVVFFDYETISLADGSSTPATEDSEGIDLYVGELETLFPEGYRVGLRGEGKHREVVDTSAYAVGRLSPDRSTLFDVGQWPTEAVVYDAETGRQRPIDAPWGHFALGGWTDEDTFFGVAQHVDYSSDNGLQEQQVVTCELATLACTPVSPVIEVPYDNDGPRLVMESGSAL